MSCGLTYTPGPVTLHVTGGQARLGDALTAWSALRPAGGIGLAWTATWCRFATLGADGALVDEHGATLNLDGVFEARVFDGDVELRWLHDIGGVGATVLLAESPLEPPAELAHPWAEHEELAGSIDGVRYLLWGGDKEPVERGAQWTTRADGRIGELAVPSPEPALAAREYLARDPHTGAVRVAEERYIGFDREVVLR